MISNDTLSFLKKLKKNNNKTWFDSNKDKYLLAKEDFENFLEALLPELKKADPGLNGVEVKGSVFRIYRDVRFSSDKRPYKNHLGAWFCSRGRKSSGPGYYLHIEPENSFIAAGIWMPSSEELAKVRQEIDYNFEEFDSILNEPKFKKLTGGLDFEDSLRSAPKGYSADNPAIKYLKLKSFTATSPLEDETVIRKTLLRNTVKVSSTMVPLIKFLARSFD